MSSTFVYRKIFDFEENKPLDEFIDHYCKPDSANKCFLTTIGYIRINSNNSTTPSDITNLIFAFHFGLQTTIHIKYFANSNECYHQTITVPLRYSLDDIWAYLQKHFTTKMDNYKSLQSIESPMFTLCSNLDAPYAISANKDTNNKYFAKILHHKLNPMILWKHSGSHSAAVLFGDDISLCVAFNLFSISHSVSNCNQWNKIFLNDYTQITDIHKYNDNIGSSYTGNAQLRKILLKIKKGISLEKFYEIVREVCKVPASEEVRAFRIYEKDKYLITFPYKFWCKQHNIMLERGRYPRYTEVFLMVCLIHANNTTSVFLPLIIEKAKTIKFLKQGIMKLFNLNPLEYNKYVCYNITTSMYQKHNYWRDSLTLNSNQTNPRHGDRVGIQVGIYTTNKTISIMTDTRNLNKICYLSFFHAKLIVFGYIKNVHIQTPNGIQHLVLLFYDSSDGLSKTNNIVKGYLNPYIQQEIGTISIKDGCNLEQLRKKIYDMEQFKNSNIKSYKYLLLSWRDNIYDIPLSFPMLQSGNLIGQKYFTSNKHVICVEILNEEIVSIPKKSRFLHIHLGKIEMNKGNNDNDINVLYWPCDHHIRIIYSEQNIHDNKQDKITYKNLSKFVCNKYNILSQNLLIAMFKVIKGDWILLGDQFDNNKQGLVGAPLNIKCASRHGQIFVIFNLSECNINNIENNEEKINYINENINKWGPPPLSNKAKFYYRHFNQKRS